MGRLSWLWQDLRFGFRSLAKDRRSALLAILALALGIGSATVIFSAVYSVIFEPVDYKDPPAHLPFCPRRDSAKGLGSPKVFDAGTHELPGANHHL